MIVDHGGSISLVVALNMTPLLLRLLSMCKDVIGDMQATFESTAFPWMPPTRASSGSRC